MTYEWQVLNLKREDMMEIEEYLIKNSLGYEGQIKLGNKIAIRCIKKKHIKIQ